MSAIPPSTAIQQFIASSGDMNVLQTPVDFGRDEKWGQYLCCCGLAIACSGFCLTAAFTPIGSCFGSTLAPHYSLKMDKDQIYSTSAINDCCCHVAHANKTIGLEKVQDVQLVENCCLTCFGLKQVNVETAATGMGLPEVQAAFLPNPEQAAEAIRLAVRMHKTMSAPYTGGMARGPEVAQGQPAQTGMAARLQAMNALVARGALTPEEAASIRVAVLAAEQDPLARLADAANSRDQQLISDKEYEQLKAAIVAQLMK